MYQLHGIAADEAPMGDHTFVCYAREDADFVLSVAKALQQRNVSLWIDAWNIEPGTDWDKTIDSSLRTCANVLIFLSPNAVASNEVRGELRTALNNEKRIVPVLYRACDIPRQLQHLQYVDFGGPGELTEGTLDALGRVLRERPALGSDTTEDQAPARTDEWRNRRDVLDDVKGETADRLAQSLGNEAILTLLKEKQPFQVTRAWDSSVKGPGHARTPAPLVIDVMDVFDDDAIAGKLLILGAPGSGKTTTLLQIARELTIRADVDALEPIPVLLSVSSWRDASQPLAGWFVDELKLKYGIRKDRSRKWLVDRRLVPLFDGLDELPPERQAECVDAINAFQQEWRPKHLVVCSRAAEYANLVTKLALNGAIHLLPLTDEQIREYLGRAGCADLWHSVAADQDARELARSPLFLSMMRFAYKDVSAGYAARTVSASERRADFFDAYLRHLFSLPATSRTYARAHTIAWLAWLADAVKRQGYEEFLIERLQPRWLQSAVQRRAYRLLVVLGIGVIVFLGFAFMVAVKTLIPDNGRLADAMGYRPGVEAWDALAIIIVALAAGVIVASTDTIRPIETLRWSRSHAQAGIALWFRKMALAGLDYGTYAGLIIGVAYAAMNMFGEVGSLWPAGSSTWENGGRLVGAVVGAGLVVTLLTITRPSTWLNEGLRRRFTQRHVDAVIAGVVIGFAAAVTVGSASGLLVGAGIAILAGLSRGLGDRGAARFVQTAMTGLVAWMGVISQVARASLRSDGWPALSSWIEVWLLGGIGVGVTAGLIVGAGARLRQGTSSVESAGPCTSLDGAVVRRWGGWLLVGMLLALVSGLACTVLARQGQFELVRRIALLANYASPALMTVLSGALLFAVSLGPLSAFMGAFFGSLFGMLTGLTGPDVQRRTVPNQGIRQSARNIWVCASIGTLAVGVPYGLLNVAASVMVTRASPELTDWLRLGVGSALVFGLMGGLIPAAACIQHFALRAVLWWWGLAPWRYVRFLEHATERMFLQRVGGRYRFIHILLRDHFAAMAGSSSAGARTCEQAVE
jgi:hypothetical protein